MAVAYEAPYAQATNKDDLTAVILFLDSTERKAIIAGEEATDRRYEVREEARSRALIQREFAIDRSKLSTVQPEN